MDIERHATTGREAVLDPDALLDRHGAAKLLAMTPNAIDLAAHRGKIPSFKTPLGQRRFKRSELLNWAYSNGEE